MAAVSYRQVGWITADEDAEWFGGQLHDDETHAKRRLPTCFVRPDRCKPVYVQVVAETDFVKLPEEGE